MTYRTPPPPGPALHAWTAIEVTLGEPLELTFLEEYGGDTSGFWECRFYSQAEQQAKVIVFRADNVAAVSVDQLQHLRETNRLIAKKRREYERMKKDLLGE